MAKSKKKKLLTLGILAAILFVILILVVGIAWSLAIYLLGSGILLVNIKAKNTIAWKADHLFSDIDRNYDYLLIGEPWNYRDEIEGKVICFFCPNRSFLSSYELARRLFSLLKENSGTLIISCTEKTLNSDSFSALDMPYLHETQLHKYGFKDAKLKTYLPFIFAPFATFRYFMNKKTSKISEIDIATYPKLSEFCRERNINCQIIITK